MHKVQNLWEIRYNKQKQFCVRPAGLIKQMARYELSFVDQKISSQHHCSSGKFPTDFRSSRISHHRKAEGLAQCLHFPQKP